MIQQEKIRLLKLLYQYRAMGFEYFKEYKPLDIPVSSIFPDEFNSLQESVAGCHLCNLSKTRKNTVFGEGKQNADLMFIGEGPGNSEDSAGKPFVGRAGALLTTIIENVLGLKRDDVYMANIVKCRPADNRVPTLEEVSACKPYLLHQIKMVNPRIIVTLGPSSYHHLMDDYDTPISKVRGEVLTLDNALLIPTYHPSFLLRNPSSKKEVYQDMLKVKSLL
jgi:DNA polymerase